MPVHWGTYDLAVHNWTEPAERLLAEAKRTGVSVFVPKPGETFEPANLRAPEQWWPDVSWQTAEQHPVVSSGL